MKVIINADDFGYCTDVNRAIEKAFRSGLISSTTILPNMPGFEEAAMLAKNKDFINRVGIHLNLFEGLPLTKEMQNCGIFCDEKGTFHKKKIRPFDPFWMDSKIIYNELYAQISKVLSAGIIPTHLDSHAQLHTNYFVGSIVIKLAKQFNIPSIRISSAVFKRERKISQIMVNLYNLRLKVNGFKCVNYVGAIPDVIPILHKLTGVVEVIVHPVLRNGSLIDFEHESEIGDLLTPFQEVIKISYADL